jgi:hypothetical protein
MIGLIRPASREAGRWGRVGGDLGLTPISDRPSEGRADFGCEKRRQ